MDRLLYVQRLARQHLHQVAGSTVAVGHEVRQTDDAGALQREVAQRLAAAGAHGRRNVQARAVAGHAAHVGAGVAGQRPVVQRFRS